MNFFPKLLNESKFIFERKHSIDIFDDGRVLVHFRVLSTINSFTFSESKTKPYLHEMFRIIESLTNNRKSVINIQYYEYNERRTLQHLKPGDEITPSEINGGVCYINSGKTDLNIVLFRSEEFFKVMCHEIIHLYNIQPDNRELDEYVKLLFPSTKMNVRMNESIVELYAIIINCMIVSKLQNREIRELLRQEYMFSLFQTFKLMDYYNITTYTTKEINEKWLETTHTFSYIVMKAFLFHVLLMTLSSDIEIVYEAYNFSPKYDKSLRMSIVDYDVMTL